MCINADNYKAANWGFWACIQVLPGAVFIIMGRYIHTVLKMIKVHVEVYTLQF